MHFAQFAKKVSMLVRGVSLKDTLSAYLVDQIAQANGLAGADYFASNILPILALAFVSSVGAYLMWLAPGIATGLVSGTGTSAAGFGSGAIGDKLRRMSGL